TTPECIACILRQASEVAELATESPALRERFLRLVLREIAEADWSVLPVRISQRVQRRVREVTGVTDPYRGVKDVMNRLALEMLPSVREFLQSCADRREAVVRLAIAGNMLDAGSKHRIEPEELPKRLHALWNVPLEGNVSALFDGAARCKRILYLADNAGEIVFDRLLIETLGPEKVTVAVRGAPVINDATLDDARVAGLPDIVKVIANGSDAPGTVLEECSPEFCEVFQNADLVIAKGQGNYETLSDSAKDTFFLLTVKCSVVARELGVPVGAMVIRCRKNKGHAAK
ncbi:MAG: ARMT1-like domain-containing protein, partial [Kiritimatiellae bacterium]|nr:ARMT1-like domain-containing protein [Kiritimatiellia bacterium]